jgi:protein ImuB
MYAVIDIPRFALQAVLRLEEGLWRKPVALVDASLAKPLVIDCTLAAERAGVLPGLSLPQAIARCEEIVVRYGSGKAEAMASRALFDCAYSLSPRVEETYPGVCSIGLAGVNRKTLEERCQEMVSVLWRLGLKGRIGIASTPDVALFVARESKHVTVVGEWEAPGRVVCRQSGDEKRDWSLAEDRPPYLGGMRSLQAFLDELPIAAAEPSEKLEEILVQWGVRSAGAFVSLSREEVGKRLGVEGLVFWDRISGREERPLRISELPTVYEESLEFEYEIDTLEPLLFIVRRFLDQLCLRLRAAAMVADSVYLKFDLADIRLEDGEPIEAVKISLKIPDPTSDSDSLFMMLSNRLEKLDTDSAVVGICLRIEPIDRNESQLGLFETSLKNPHRFTQTLAQVAGIVGADNVGRPRLKPSGCPDGVTLERLSPTTPPMKGRGTKERFGLALRRFRPPLEAEVRVWERQPVWFHCSRAGGTVVLCRGPWAHSGQWWEPDGWNRLEWDVELRAGGVYRLVKERARWTVEGMYD